MEITMARGDLEVRDFQILDSEQEPFTDTFDEIYFTVKKSASNTDYEFQKRLNGGGISHIGDGTYRITIYPEDTDRLQFGTYAFDIELVINGRMKKTYLGKLNLEREVTHAVNEVSSP